MTWKENITKLIDHNGGWWVVGRNLAPFKIGEILDEYQGVRPTVIALATNEEAEADCKFLGLPRVLHDKYLAKVIMD